MMLIQHVIRDRSPLDECVGVGPGAPIYGSAQRLARLASLTMRQAAGRFSERDVLRRVVGCSADAGIGKGGRRYQRLRAVINCDETPHQRSRGWS